MKKRFGGEFWRNAVVAFKLTTGGAEAAFGIAILALSAAGFDRLVNQLVRAGLRHDPHGHVIVLIERQLPSLLANKTWIAFALLALGCLKVTGAVGLLFRRPWAYYLLVALLALLLPFDAYRAVARPSILGALLFALNVSALGVLLHYRKLFLHFEGV